MSLRIVKDTTHITLRERILTSHDMAHIIPAVADPTEASAISVCVYLSTRQCVILTHIIILTFKAVLDKVLQHVQVLITAGIESSLNNSKHQCCQSPIPVPVKVGLCTFVSTVAPPPTVQINRTMLLNASAMLPDFTRHSILSLLHRDLDRYEYRTLSWSKPGVMSKEREQKWLTYPYPSMSVLPVHVSLDKHHTASKHTRDNIGMWPHRVPAPGHRLGGRGPHTIWHMTTLRHPSC